MSTESRDQAGQVNAVIELEGLLRRALGDIAPPPEARGVMLTGICDDSRQVASGALFIAVPGTRVQGAAFAGEAASRGAAAIVADGFVDVPPGPIAIKVSNARVALAKIAAAWYGLDEIQACGELKATGITGTNGKSTIAYMLRSILRGAGRMTALLGTIEYDLCGETLAAPLTTPAALVLTRHLTAAHKAGAREVVMEVSSHSLDQCRTDGVVFDTAIFTNLTQDHLDYHQTPEAYLLAKRRLFDGLRENAVAVINGDEPAADRIVENCKARVVRFGTGPNADAKAVILEEGRGGCRFTLDFEGSRDEFFTPMVGRHNAMNALAAVTAALIKGIAPQDVRKGLAGLSYVPGRLQPVDSGDLGFDVFVDYAHTDDALRNVLRASRPLAKGRLWCVFGCGGDRDRTKRAKMAQAVAEGADRMVITSDNPRTEDPLSIISDIEQGLGPADRERSVTEPDRTCAIGFAISRLEPGDVLVIAGKGHENYQILGTEKMHFDDIEVARGAIQRRAKPR